MALFEEDASTEHLTLDILRALSRANPISSNESFPSIPFASMKAALDRLAARSMVTYQQIQDEEISLEAEAKDIVKYGSHEARVFEPVRARDGLSLQQLEDEIGNMNVAKMGRNKAFKRSGLEGTKRSSLLWLIQSTTLPETSFKSFKKRARMMPRL